MDGGSHLGKHVEASAGFLPQKGDSGVRKIRCIIFLLIFAE